MKNLDASPKDASAPAFSMADMKLTGLDLHRPINAMSVPGWRPGMPIGRVELESAT